MSAETMYQTLFLQARGELRTQLKLALRTGRTSDQPVPDRRDQGEDLEHGHHQ